MTKLFGRILIVAACALCVAISLPFNLPQPLMQPTAQAIAVRPTGHDSSECVEMPEELTRPDPPATVTYQQITAPQFAGEIKTEIDGAVVICLGLWHITEYCPCKICNGGYTGTASGNPLTPGQTVASNSLALGKRVYIEGYGWRVVEDRGGGGSRWIDILVETHEDAQSVEGSTYRLVYAEVK